jgi:hypothetical protein
MSVQFIVQVFVSSRSKLEAPDIEGVVYDVASTSTFHGCSWTYHDGTAVGGLYQFERSLHTPEDAEASTIIRDIQRGIRRAVGAGPTIDVRVLNADQARWVVELRRRG